ncbi:ECF transporter S component [Clostridium disporicum]|uniref:Predicted membrane protein n=1 Tax=Clostridium disporicum TaxID=84024 RepID=A0A174LJQ9_9CLOT|nr:ECF transporter S component [Clostridium disporicum]CUP24452.1 Predicted membrane protein [Clostridium disporicum]
MMKERTKELVWASLFLAIGVIIPYIFHATSLPGQVFLPMHIPVLLCGVILGKKYGVIVGILLPFINSALLGMPPLYPTAISMAFELATYGFITGLLYKDKKCNIFVSLIGAMLVGRIVSGIVNYVLLTVGGSGFVFAAFITSTFVKAVPGIIIQLILIPAILKALEYANKGKVVANE